LAGLVAANPILLNAGEKAAGIQRQIALVSAADQT
jgi:hypothetical protein